MTETTTGTKSIGIPQIDKLRGTANFHTWRSMSITFLDIMGVWDVVNGKTTKPAGLSTQTKWMQSSQRAKGFLLLNVDKGLMPLVSSAADATTAWKRLEEKFDRKTTTTLHSLMKTILTLRCSNKREIASHIEQFDELWDRLLQRTSEATTSSTTSSTTTTTTTASASSTATASTSPPSSTITETLESLLLPLASSPIAKGAFFITSLPTTLDNVIDNLTTKDTVTYTDICNKLLDLYPTASQTQCDNTAFLSTSGRQDRRKGRSDQARDGKICGYCKSKGFRGMGHLESECRTKKREKGGTAATAQAANTDQKAYRRYAFPTTDSRFPPGAWILDSGASVHMTDNLSLLEDVQPTESSVTIGNGKEVLASAIGTATINAQLSNGTLNRITLCDTLYIPELRFSLISWRKMAEAGAEKIGDVTGTKIYKDGNLALETIPHGGLEIVRAKKETTAITVMQLHRQLAHLPPSAFSSLKGCMDDIPEGGIPKVEGNFACEACIKAKFVRTIPKVRTTKAQNVFETVHTDICGPFSHETPTGNRYFISFIDEFSHYSLVRFLRTRDEAPKILMELIQLVERQYDVKVKKIQCDNAGEFSSTKFKEQLSTLGIQQKFSIAYIHETNGTAERFNRTICGSARALLFDSHLPSTLWAEAVAHATFTKNRIPHASLTGTTPYTIVTKRSPSLTGFQPFGTAVYVYIPEERRHIAGKLLPRSEAAFLVGYASGEERNQFRFWIPEGRKIRIARDFKPRHNLSSVVQPNTEINPDGINYEIDCTPYPATEHASPSASQSPVLPGPSGSSVTKAIHMSSQDTNTIQPLTAAQLRERYPALFPEVPELSRPDASCSIVGGFPADEPPESPARPNTEEPSRDSSPVSSLPDSLQEATMATAEPEDRELTVTRAGRVSRPPNRYGLGLSAEYALLMRTTIENSDEPTVQEALNGPEKREWNAALQKEIEAIQGYGTWEEATPPPQARFIGTKWVL